ncbi:hypothetical protein PN492_04605 [Dolichospermum circinale CS-537/01]|uniref:Type I restriction enzyme R protein N-terminal domain-containing protein n=1 Tax=Dolichospermum circinale CS-537/01 TaxID=3021739 RepID=A0ABT5A3X8_9CYAN|nr:hypothetical protein [Dolichospermum circinale]MDB9485831.1 hypothetical protein [Dolichospermum circinale CS-537/01]
MSCNQYKNIAQVLGDFPLTYQEENFIQENPLEIDDYFRNRFELVLREGVVFNSEYAICEGVIFPILIEIWQKYKDKLLIWSHQPLNFDERLSGILDYIVAKRSPRGKIVFESPYLILVEAKKDNFEEGWGQCLAELIAAQKLNNQPEQLLYGIVSNGKIWEFGQLRKQYFIKNIQEYSLSNLDKLFAGLNFVFAQS